MVTPLATSHDITWRRVAPRRNPLVMVSRSEADKSLIDVGFLLYFVTVVLLLLNFFRPDSFFLCSQEHRAAPHYHCIGPLHRTIASDHSGGLLGH
jgi:hypothetical protein